MQNENGRRERILYILTIILVCVILGAVTIGCNMLSGRGDPVPTGSGQDSTSADAPDTSSPPSSGTVDGTDEPGTDHPITDPPVTEPPVTEPPEDTVPSYGELGFKSDLSAYEQYMNPENRDGYLLLINKEHPVASDWVPDGLVFVPQEYCVYEGEYQAKMVEIASKALTAMLIEAKNYGIDDVKLTLAYRNYWTQNWLYTSYIKEEMEKGLTEEEAIKVVQTYSAPPGTSEHQSGLCTDMHNVYNKAGKELEDFEDTEAYVWLRDNCWKFGFIIRFPKGKESITGYQFECWHFRFVGRYHAYKIFNSGLCLEEYLDRLD